MNNIQSALKLISVDPNSLKEFLDILSKEFSMPNFPLPTLGGEFFWNTIYKYNEWKLQQNMVTQHARILDSEDVRVAWGTISAMEKALDRFVEGKKRYKEKETTSSERIEVMTELKLLKELLDAGVLSESEYNEKKAKLMKRL